MASHIASMPLIDYHPWEYVHTIWFYGDQIVYVMRLLNTQVYRYSVFRHSTMTFLYDTHDSRHCLNYDTLFTQPLIMALYMVKESIEIEGEVEQEILNAVQSKLSGMADARGFVQGQQDLVTTSLNVDVVKFTFMGNGETMTTGRTINRQGTTVGNLVEVTELKKPIWCVRIDNYHVKP